MREHQVAVAALQEAGLHVAGGAREVDGVGGETPARPEAEGDAFEAELLRIELLLAADRRVALACLGDVVERGAEVPPAAAVPERVRPGAEAEVRAGLPVPEVVHALVAGPRPVRDLVVAVARSRQEVTGELEHVGLEVRVRRGSRTVRHLAPQGRGRLDGERVRRDVLGSERDRLLERAPPRAQGLPFRPVDEVEVDVVVPGLSRRGVRSTDGVRRVHSLQRQQHALVERLRSHGQPREPGDS